MRRYLRDLCQRLIPAAMRDLFTAIRQSRPTQIRARATQPEIGRATPGLTQAGALPAQRPTPQTPSNLPTHMPPTMPTLNPNGGAAVTELDIRIQILNS